MIWKETTKVGLGYRTGPNGTVLVVNYDPAGNEVHKFGTNVLLPLQHGKLAVHHHAFSNSKMENSPKGSKSSVAKKKKLKKKSKTKI
jgi:hypothetical protein